MKVWKYYSICPVCGEENEVAVVFSKTITLKSCEHNRGAFVTDDKWLAFPFNKNPVPVDKNQTGDGESRLKQKIKDEE